nr:hypothetical protein Iba_chr10cCG6770 [Ipomoea batatas]GMD45210.1 hypothetical protein Iba_chr10dCG7840 [Ipomoea batatas]
MLSMFIKKKSLLLLASLHWIHLCFGPIFQLQGNCLLVFQENWRSILPVHIPALGKRKQNQTPLTLIQLSEHCSVFLGFQQDSPDSGSQRLLLKVM